MEKLRVSAGKLVALSHGSNPPEDRSVTMTEKTTEKKRPTENEESPPGKFTCLPAVPMHDEDRLPDSLDYQAILYRHLPVVLQSYLEPKNLLSRLLNLQFHIPKSRMRQSEFNLFSTTKNKLFRKGT